MLLSKHHIVDMYSTDGLKYLVQSGSLRDGERLYMKSNNLDVDDIDLHIISKIDENNNIGYQISCYVHSKNMSINSKYPSEIYFAILKAYGKKQMRRYLITDYAHDICGWSRFLNVDDITLRKLWFDYETKSFEGIRSCGKDHHSDGSIIFYVDDSDVDINKVRKICKDNFGVESIEFVIRKCNFRFD